MLEKNGKKNSNIGYSKMPFFQLPSLVFFPIISPQANTELVVVWWGAMVEACENKRDDE